MTSAISNTLTQASETPSATDQSLTTLSNNFDSFLKLLTTQLQNQDPLSPMESHEFTNQLVMFAEAEQAIATNKKLDSLIEIEQKNEAAQALNYYGKEVRVKGNKLSFHGDPVTFQYSLPENSVLGTMVVRNEEGKLMLEKPLEGSQMTEGLHDVTWDGRNKYGYQLPKGLYTVTISAKNGAGKPVEISDMSVASTVKGVEHIDGEVWLDMGFYQVTMDNVVSVTTAGFKMEDQVRAMNFVGKDVYITGSTAPVKDGKLDLVYDTSGIEDLEKTLDAEDMDVGLVLLRLYDQSDELVEEVDITSQLSDFSLEGGERRISTIVPELQDSDYRGDMYVRFDPSDTESEGDSNKDPVSFEIPMGHAGRVRRVVFDQGKALIEVNSVLYNPNDVSSVLNASTTPLHEL